MTAEAIRFEPYQWRGGREWMVERGPRNGPLVIVLQPLFEEMNFTRAVLAAMTVGLAARGIRSWLPDLPGTGESLSPLGAIGWQDWRDAVAAIGAAAQERTGTLPHSCAVRGGALLDDALATAARWRFAPCTGESLLRQLRRTQMVSDRESGTARAEEGEQVELAGYALGQGMRQGLESAVPAAGAHERAAEPGDAVWRRAEPGRNDALAERLAQDIAQWIAACGGH